MYTKRNILLEVDVSKSASQTVTVTLLKPHEHKEVKYVAGAQIDVLPYEHQWLIDKQIVAADSSIKVKE